MIQIKKYIIAESFTVIFDPVLKHEDIASNLPYNIIGAGYVTIETRATNRFYKVKCWSKMGDPGLKCNLERDRKTLERFLELDGVGVVVG